MQPIPKSWLMAAVLLGTTISALPAAESKVDSSTFGGLRARAIGPAVMSGRVASIDGVASDPVVLYIGSASGGVWKSEDGGTVFKPIFDEHTQSIGAVRVDPSNPDNVWVGTGESWTRNSTSTGTGVYKSTDAGSTWKLVGLPDSERIGAIRIHPTNGDIVYVCATGHLFGSHEERGVFKTSDGGETWDKVLYVDADTGCADIDIDPQEPDVLYAGMWQFRRSASFFTSGGPGSGLYRSKDGGENWQRLESGLPTGDLGRIAVAVAPSRPNVVYATVEAAETALYRSDDLGSTWTKTNASQNVQMRPFYFSELVVDPVDHNRVYKPGFMLTISIDGGKSFNSLFGGGFGASVHPDHHALWINPKNPYHAVLGTDGGVYISYDRAGHWNHMKTLPLSQPYQVGFDMEWPYNVYGGLQDNGSWVGPSRKAGGVGNADWHMLSFGDGFWVHPDPEDSNIAYSESQGGALVRVDRRIDVIKSIFPYPEEGQEPLRFNWNTPIHLSSHEKGMLYFGSQYLHRSRDKGETWESISPDLTTDDPERQRQKQSGGLTIDNSTAENNCTIYSISESPVEAGVLWIGTDDGNVQVTRDDGKTWTNVVANVPDLPAGSWVSSVHASPHDAATAFATFDLHYAGDTRPYFYRTTDFGATWESLVKEPVEGYAHVIEQDPVNADLLYLGTEFGLWISIDGGEQWARFKENLPRVSVQDIAIHPREHDLILATHGRGFYIIDDLTPLRHLTPEVREADVSILPSQPSPMVLGGAGFPFGTGGDDEFAGEVPAGAARITYYLKKRHMFGDLKIEIYDAEDNLLVSLPGGKRRGLNRVDWMMRLKAPRLPAATNLVPAFTGPRVPEGTYRVKLIKGKKTLDGEISLAPDPRSPYSEEDRKLQQKVALDLYFALEDLAFLTEQLIHLRDGANQRAESLKKGDQKKIEAFAERAEALRATLVSTSKAGWISGDVKLREDLGNLYGNISTYDGRPTNSQLDEMKRLMVKLEQAGTDVAALTGSELGQVNGLLKKRGAEAIEALDQDAWKAENSGGGSAAAMLFATKSGRLALPAVLNYLRLGL